MSFFEEPTYLATEAEADREFAHNVGAQRPDQAWILSDRDVWYRNCAYTGPDVPHPEDDHDFDDDDVIEPDPEADAFYANFVGPMPLPPEDDDLPF